MVSKLWKPVRVCICETLPVEFVGSCRVGNVVGKISDSVGFIVRIPQSLCVCLTSRAREHLGAACEDEKGHAGGAHTHEESRDAL